MAGASLAGILAGCAASNVATNPLVPENLKVPAGQTLSLVSPATGVQIYECGVTKTEPARFEWVFKAPEDDRQTLCGSDLGIERWKQSGGPSQGAGRRSEPQRHPVVAAERKFNSGK